MRQVEEEEMDYETYSYGTQRISADNDTVELALIEGLVKPQAPSNNDLLGAVEWLAIYGCGHETEGELEMAQSFANVIAFLELTVEARLKRKAVNQLKRNYAKEHGVKVRQVRIQKEAI
jgi:hypothetical protein